jgi:hypothetical protein
MTTGIPLKSGSAFPSFKEIDASSKEYQIVKMTGMMNFHIDPSFVNELYQKVATAKSESESIILVAQGQAKANDVLSRSITPILVSYESIEK